MLDLAGWLKQHIPKDDSSGASGTGLVHGDFRVDNLVFHPEEVGIDICLCVLYKFRIQNHIDYGPSRQFCCSSILLN